MVSRAKNSKKIVTKAKAVTKTRPAAASKAVKNTVGAKKSVKVVSKVKTVLTARAGFSKKAIVATATPKAKKPVAKKTSLAKKAVSNKSTTFKLTKAKPKAKVGLSKGVVAKPAKNKTSGLNLTSRSKFNGNEGSQSRLNKTNAFKKSFEAGNKKSKNVNNTVAGKFVFKPFKSTVKSGSALNARFTNLDTKPTTTKKPIVTKKTVSFKTNAKKANNKFPLKTPSSGKVNLKIVSSTNKTKVTATKKKIATKKTRTSSKSARAA